MVVGDIYPTNFWGDIRVVEYLNNKNILVMFIESGNTLTVQKDNILKGLVKDMRRQMKETSDRRESIKKEKALSLALSKYKIKINKLNIHIQLSHKRYELLKRREVKNSPILGKVYNHERYGDYQIISIEPNSKCTIKFFNSNYTHKTTIAAAKGGRVRDYIQFSEEAERLIRRENSASRYQNNRDELLQKAKDWQRDNPAKCRVRNQNRRARRKSAEGTHTIDELNQMLLDQDGLCNCCKTVLGGDKHLDHIMPLVLGGCNWIENLQWLCSWCNLSKNGKHPDVWNEEITTPEFWLRREAAKLSRLH